jgi:hypothetical protein
MRTQRWSGCEGVVAWLCPWLATALFLLASYGCQTPAPTGSEPAEPSAKAVAGSPADDSAFTLVNADETAQVSPQAPRLVHQLAVLHVLVPEQGEATVEKIWNFLREDAFDAETESRLRQNGLRIGVGHAQWWAPIKTALDGIDDHRVTFEGTVRVPVGFPLSLELDSEARGQTLFYVGSDGILSGGTWPDSRNVLRVSYVPDVHDADNVVMQVVPEVHQRQSGWKWVRTEAGLWEVPRQSKQTFQAAGFVLTLSPGEFVLVAPSENSRIYGLLGRALLTRECEGRHYNSYVFLRPETRHVGQDD